MRRQPVLCINQEFCTGIGSLIAAQSNVDFAIDVQPFGCAAQPSNHVFECAGMFWSVFKPSQEIEWLTEFAAMVQASRNRRQIVQTDSNMPRLLFENGSSFILSQIPPRRRFADRNERRARSFRSRQTGLFRNQRVHFRLVRVTRIARDAAQDPRAIRIGLGRRRFNDSQTLGHRQSGAHDRFNTVDPPMSG